MSKVDWSLAPAWCKGFGLIGIGEFEVWFDDHHYEYLHDGNKHAFGDACTFKFCALSSIEERPKAATWSGPEDGLPPVGTVCELSESVLLADSETSDWFEAGTKVEVGGHAMFDGATGPVCVICVVDENFTGTIAEGCLRSIRTPEQLAAEDREKAVIDFKQVLDELSQDYCMHLTPHAIDWLAVRLDRAGFKREVK